MRKLFALLALTLFASTAQAASSESVRVKLEGTVKFQFNMTMTCMAIGCPPSQPFFNVELRDARSADGQHSFPTLTVEGIRTAFGVAQKPEAIEFNGVTIRENDVIVVDLQVRSFPAVGIAFAGAVHSVEKK